MKVHNLLFMRFGEDLVKRLCRLVVQLAIYKSVLLNTAWAQTSPAGLWQSVDDGTGTPRALIRIREANGVFTGVIERSLRPLSREPRLHCDLCTDDRKGQLLVGMEIIRGIRKQPNADVWDGGEILDPDNGKTYRLQLRLQADAKTMQVRGFIGLFFRTQTWTRTD
jgi:uncharacterized protein (DUF2147 family)